MKQEIIQRLDAVRTVMAKAGVSAVIIPQTDPHQSEYLAEHWEVRRYLSGFTGSAGTLVVTTDSAALWVDSRYYLQGAQQIEGAPIELMKDGLADTPSIRQYLVDKLPHGAVVGIDGMLFSVSAAYSLRKELSAYDIKLDTDVDVADDVWPDRPTLPKSPVFVHEVKYAGESAADKIAGIRRFAQENKADSVFISALDEIAWTLNIRCTDVEFNPVATSYLYVGADECVLFVDTDKIDAATDGYLKSQGVGVKAYSEVKAFLASLPETEKVAIEPARTSVAVADILGKRAVDTTSAVAIPKACKNDVQIVGFRAAMQRDGVALVKAFKHIEEAVARGEKITEMDVADILREYRSQQPLYFDESFATIAGYGPHGAIVHYEATPETDVELHADGLLLVDSGAQYLDGTTDITRTITLGNPTPRQKHDFTLVMKGYIALDTMVFPVGTHGVQLDAEARKYLWREGLGYMHGTGHGIGHFLNVHEGPQTIRLNYTPVPMMERMITSNEPGLYREGMHGVRCENLILTTKAMSTEFGDFLRFETLTLYPFDLDLFETEIMSDEEIDWVNNYHRKVYEALAPDLTDDEAAWLKKKIQTLKKQ